MQIHTATSKHYQYIWVQLHLYFSCIFCLWLKQTHLKVSTPVPPRLTCHKKKIVDKLFIPAKNEFLPIP